MQNLFIKWQNDYNLGIPIIDEQHRTIVSTINSYHHFCSKGIGESMLKPIFVTMQQYTIIHFLTEENILKEIRYPDESDHLKFHDVLKKKMLDIAREAIFDNDFEPVLSFLKQWWLNHILVEDMKYAAYMRKKQILI